MEESEGQKKRIKRDSKEEKKTVAAKRKKVMKNNERSKFRKKNLAELIKS